ncbi:hypothetical protein K2Z84_21455 [Candidatus Binatia bacterium]|nr:hypothetical protein [Candidatus Binatia bacterium]
MTMEKGEKLIFDVDAMDAALRDCGLGFNIMDSGNAMVGGYCVGRGTTLSETLEKARTYAVQKLNEALRQNDRERHELLRKAHALEAAEPRPEGPPMLECPSCESTDDIRFLERDVWRARKVLRVTSRKVVVDDGTYESGEEQRRPDLWQCVRCGREWDASAATDDERIEWR